QEKENVSRLLLSENPENQLLAMQLLLPYPQQIPDFMLELGLIRILGEALAPAVKVQMPFMFLSTQFDPKPAMAQMRKDLELLLF
ncbi:hypothetical protein, partial [Propionibacterium freudenreichii]|uniref:hypothetical protein n=1 Tax=Propionibacterium freudenreichii TaxID=1744 RepID=UPI003854CAF1